MVTIPKVFISYSWSNLKHENDVMSLAKRLSSHGVSVVLDKWDLKEGQDKYAFMEQAVTDPEIDKVLLICDQTYTFKANSRTGGVGDETAIISPELYGKTKQERFIPIVFEVNEEGAPYLPAYVQSRIYINLSSDDKYESEYEKLLRSIYNEPLYKKPTLGQRPQWLDTDTTSLSPLTDLVKQIKYCQNNNSSKSSLLLNEFIDLFPSTLKEIGEINDSSLTGELVVNAIEKTIPLRNLYVDFLSALVYADLLHTDNIIKLIENTYNAVMIHNASTHSHYDLEQYKFFIWEMFLCTTSFLFHHEKFEQLNTIVKATYFLKHGHYPNSAISEKFFTHFRVYFFLIEDDYKPKSENPRLYSYSAKILVQNEYKPIITKSSLVFADILLCKLSYIYNLSNDRWFPTSYIYNDSNHWIKLKSKAYCEKILPLFDVSSIEALKVVIVNNPISRDMSYRNSFDPCTDILAYLKAEDIGSLN